jgi:DNA-binding response OmpR family regulator
MRAVTRRAEGKQDARRLFTAGELEVDLRSRSALLHGQELSLTPKEFDLLALLASDPGAVFERRRILQEVWGTSWQGAGKTVDVHVASLRKKLGDPAWIETLRGVGLVLRPQ